MKHILFFLCISLLTSCSLIRPHRATVTQGNIIDKQTMQTLHKGASKETVKNTMGTPLLTNLFTLNRINYIYTHQAAYQDPTINRLAFLFHGEHLNAIDRS